MKSIMVTGASTGIGRATVTDLLAAGYHVWAAVRTESDEAALREAGASVLRMDLTDADSIKAAGETVRAAGPLHGLVNNAGVATPGPLEYLPIELFRHQIEVNLVGQLAVTQAMLPALRAALEEGGGARIVMVGSVSGRIAGPMLGAYSSSKFGLTGLTDSLRAELAPSGIRVALIEPGPIATPIWQRSGAEGDRIIDQLPPEGQQRYAKQISLIRAVAAQSAKRGLPPERVAKVIRHALTSGRPKARYLVGPQAHVGALLSRVSFRLTRRLTAARG